MGLVPPKVMSLRANIILSIALPKSWQLCGLYWGNIGIMEKKMETAIKCEYVYIYRGTMEKKWNLL